MWAEISPLRAGPAAPAPREGTSSPTPPRQNQADAQLTYRGKAALHTQASVLYGRALGLLYVQQESAARGVPPVLVLP